MTEIIPTIGRIVLYKFSDYTAGQVNRRRADAKEKMAWHAAIKSGAQVHVGNEVLAGDIFPMIITRVWGDTTTSSVNGSVFLDGNDIFWATSISVGEKEGSYAWMDYQKGQAAKTEALEKKLEEKV